MSESEGRRDHIRALFDQSAGRLPDKVRKEARALSRKVAVSSTRRPTLRRKTGLEPGARIADRYVIKRELGRGGVATVYQATDTKFDVQVAIKVAAASGEAVEEFRVRFQREARISYLIGKAPGIIRALDWGDLIEGTSLYLVLDLIPGASPLELTGPRSQRLQRLDQAVRLVDRVHRHGIVHRDIKPGNFLVDRGGHIHLGDFGTAKSLRGEAESDGPGEPQLVTKTGVLIGTPQFMAPEQFNDPRQVELPADVYALGVMLYHALTGSHPYEGESPVEFLSVLLKTRYGLVPSPKSPHELDPKVPRRLSELSMAAIDLDPDQRPRHAGEFLRRLRGAPDEGDQRPLWERLGLDADGFTSLQALKALRASLGDEAFLAALAGTPALYAATERPVQDKTHYQGKVGFLLRRSSKGPGSPITLGRTQESDLAVSLVSVSKAHLRFTRDDEGWSLTDMGSSNGTHLGASKLSSGEERALSPGDEIRLAQHLTLEFLPPLELLRRLS